MGRIGCGGENGAIIRPWPGVVRCGHVAMSIIRRPPVTRYHASFCVLLRWLDDQLHICVRWRCTAYNGSFISCSNWSFHAVSIVFRCHWLSFPDDLLSQADRLLYLVFACTTWRGEEELVQLGRSKGANARLKFPVGN